MKKWFKRFSLGLMAVLLILFICVYKNILYIDPFKFVDPYHPQFNPKKFNFEDYTISNCSQKEILAKLFPIGTDISFVDQILVDTGGAKKMQSTNHDNKINYIYSPKIFALRFLGVASVTWNISVIYSSDSKVIDIRLPEGRGVSVYNFYHDCKLGLDYGRYWK